MPFTYHRQSLTNDIDLANSTGIEIGPLVNPMVRKSESNVHYVDRATTEELKEWYAKDPALNVDDIMDISYVWGDQSLAEATGGEEQFDYCIASHVIEHIPDLITWLNEISSVLKPGGIASFAVPDRHYTFDYLRPETTLADLVDAHLKKLRKPTSRHIYDHFANFAEVDVMTAWSKDFKPDQLKRKNTKERIYGVCKDALENDKYIDSHCSVFSFDSFFNLLQGISELGLLDFQVKKVFPTKRGMFEFFVQLEKLDSQLDAKEKFERFTKSLEQGTFFEVTMSADTPCVSKLYFDAGNGFCEQDTTEVHYRTPQQAQTLRFELPHANIKQFRFDPSDHELEIEINQIRITDDTDRIDIELDSVNAANDFIESKLENGTLYCLTAPEATDPYFLVNIG